MSEALGGTWEATRAPIALEIATGANLGGGLVVDLVSANASQVFTPPALREIMSGGYFGQAYAALRRVRSGGPAEMTASDTVGGTLEAVHRWLLLHRRTEHVYKNAVANQLLLRRHRISRTTMLSEFKVGSSVADCVIVNGRGTAYEIKTELDNSARLRQQLEDYARVFSIRVVVTHHTLVESYQSIVQESGAGLMALGPRGGLQEIIEATPDESRLDTVTMMKALRKSEYERIVASLTGDRITVPNGRHFSAHAAVARDIPTERFHHEFLDALRQRRLPAGSDARDLATVRHLVFKIGPTSRELQRLKVWLNLKIDRCTTHICEANSTNC